MKKLFPLAILFVALLVIVPATQSHATSPVVGGVDGMVKRHVFQNAGERAIVVGWAGDLESNNAPVTVTVTSPTLGGEIVGRFETTVTRIDAQNAYGGHANKGFNWVIPSRFYTNSNYDFKFYASVNPDEYLSHPIGSMSATIPGGDLRASVDTVNDKWVVGWAVDLDGEDLRKQKTAVLVTVDGEQVAIGLTGKIRNDVQAYWTQRGYPLSNNHGFEIDIDMPDRFRDGGIHMIQVYALEFTEGAMRQIGQTYYKAIDFDGMMH